MKKVLIVGLVIASVSTFAFIKNDTPKYSVVMSVDEWQAVLNGMESTKNYLKSSNLPAKDVTFLCDSILSPIQGRFASQINLQIQKEQDSTKKKK